LWKIFSVYIYEYHQHLSYCLKLKEEKKKIYYETWECHPVFDGNKIDDAKT